MERKQPFWGGKSVGHRKGKRGVRPGEKKKKCGGGGGGKGVTFGKIIKNCPREDRKYGKKKAKKRGGKREKSLSSKKRGEKKYWGYES